MATERVDRAIANYTIHGSEMPPIIGRLIAKGLHDELSAEAYAVVDAVDGRAHHVRFRDAETLELATPIGGIVEVRGPNARKCTAASHSLLIMKLYAGVLRSDRNNCIQLRNVVVCRVISSRCFVFQIAA